MMPTAIVVFLLLVFAASLGLTRLILHYARRRGWLAVPNHRSSHKVPTPRGGGLGIVLVFLSALTILWAGKIVPQPLAVAFLGGGLMVAVVSFIDDRRNVHVGIRLTVQFVAVAWALFFIGDLTKMNLGWRIWYLDFFTHLVPLGMVWMINMYNFMDGLDGLAGSEVVLVGGGGGAFLAFAGAWDLAIISWMIAVSVAGFLVWNWPPAKIFMSDVGSIFLGFVLAVLAVASERSGAMPLLLWLILLLVFVVDATFTTVSRFVKGEEWFAGHHNFAFQQMLKRGYTHRQVTLGILAINVFLVALAALAWSKPMWLTPLFMSAFIVLALAWWWIQRKAQA